MLNVKVSDSGRVYMACGADGHLGAGEVQVARPDSWDWATVNPLDWVLVDGALVYDPIPEPVSGENPTEAALIELADLAASNAARLDEQDAALIELANILTGGN